MTSERYIADAEALKIIIDTLNAANPETRERLLHTAATFFGFGSPRQSSGISNSTLVEGSPIKTVAFSEDRGLSPKQFLLEKSPRTDVERVACLAYYLTHFREQRFFKTSDISELNTEAAQPKFSNTAFAVANAAKQGYLVAASGGAKQLSAQGERFVEALPDRFAAREAMNAGRRKRKSKKNTEQR